METRNIELTLEQARELYKDEKFKAIVLNTYTEEELFPKPKTWGEIVDILSPSYYIDSYSSIEVVFQGRNLPKDYNTLPSEKDAKKILALCRIAVIADYYNKQCDPKYPKRYYPVLIYGKITMHCNATTDWHPFPFEFVQGDHLKEAVKYNQQIFLDALSE